jgi:hypothetical protein
MNKNINKNIKEDADKIIKLAIIKQFKLKNDILLNKANKFLLNDFGNEDWN